MIRIVVDSEVQLLVDEVDIPLGPVQEACVLVAGDAGEAGIGRDQLVEILWSLPPDQAHRQRLRQVIYSINRKVGRAVVDGTGGVVRLAEGVVFEVGAGAWLGPRLSHSGADISDWCERFLIRTRTRIDNDFSIQLEASVKSGEWWEASRIASRWIAMCPGSSRAQLAQTSIGRAVSIVLRPGADQATARLRGRDGEVAELSRILSLSQTVLVHGEAGIGKTRLGLEVEARLSAESIDVYRVSCSRQSASTHHRFGPITDTLREGLTRREIERSDDVWASALLEIWAGDEQPPRPLDDYIAGAALGVRILAEAAPIVLIVDDVHDASAFTRAIVRLVSHQPRCGLLLLSRFGDDLISDDHVRRIELGPLDADAVRLLRLDAGVPESDLQSDCQEGNPLLALELARRANREARDSKFTGFDEVVESLDSAAQAALTIVRHCAPATVSQLSDDLRVSRPRAASVAQELSELGLILLSDSGGFVLRHQLVGETVDRVVPLAIRIGIHEALARRFQDSEGGIARALLHRSLAGDRRTAPRLALEAAIRGADRARPEEVESLCRVAALSVDTHVSAHAHFVHGQLLQQLGSLHDSLCHYRVAKELGAPPSVSMLRLVSCLTSVEVAVGELDPQAGLDRLLSVLDDVDPTSDGFLAALEEAIRLADRSLQIGRARELIGRLKCVTSTGSGVRECEILLVRSLDALYGDVGDGLDAARKGLETAITTGNPQLIARTAHRLYVILLHQGLAESDEARRCLDTLDSALEEHPDVRLRYTRLSNEAAWALDRLELDRADRLLERAAAVIFGTDSSDEALNLLCNRGELALRRRDYQLAERHFATGVSILTIGTRRSARAHASAGLAISRLLGRGVFSSLELDDDRSPRTEWRENLVLVAEFEARLTALKGQRDESIRQLESYFQAGYVRFRSEVGTLLLLEAEIRQASNRMNGPFRRRALKYAELLGPCPLTAQLSTALGVS